MTRLEKCELLKDKGYKYDPETGKVYGISGKEIVGKSKTGYIWISSVSLFAHHFGWYWVYGNVDFEMLDHINRNRVDNKISNLRITNHLQNSRNNDAKGFGFHKRDKKWFAQIWVIDKKIWLGYHNTKEEARQAYLSAKEKYYKI
jgi:hypothetical protein